jgi:hypothetical protein
MNLKYVRILNDVWKFCLIVIRFSAAYVALCVCLWTLLRWVAPKWLRFFAYTHNRGELFVFLGSVWRFGLAAGLTSV